MSMAAILDSPMVSAREEVIIRRRYSVMSLVVKEGRVPNTSRMNTSGCTTLYAKTPKADRRIMPNS